VPVRTGSQFLFLNVKIPIRYKGGGWNKNVKNRYSTHWLRTWELDLPVSGQVKVKKKVKLTPCLT